MAEQVASSARTAGVPVLRGRASPGAGAAVLWPWWQALQELLRATADLLLTEHAMLPPEVARSAHPAAVGAR